MKTSKFALGAFLLSSIAGAAEPLSGAALQAMIQEKASVVEFLEGSSRTEGTECALSVNRVGGELLSVSLVDPRSGERMAEVSLLENIEYSATYRGNGAFADVAVSLKDARSGVAKKLTITTFEDTPSFDLTIKESPESKPVVCSFRE